MMIDAFAPAHLGPIVVRNRFIKAATFEAMARDHQVSDALIEYHRAVALGGVGMTTLAYCAVSRDGQGAPGEIVMCDEAGPGLEKFAAAVHETGASACIQIGHAGPVAAGVGRKGLAPSKVFAPQAMRFTRAATEDDIARVTADFANAAGLAARSGFDVIELHFGHGYLISAFLSPRLNRRDDRWGGSVENRARFARQVATAARDAAGGAVAITAKLNMADGVEGGLWLDDSVQVAQLLEIDGALDALQLTGGSSFQNPMYLFRGDAPIAEMAAVFPRALRPGFKLTAKRFMRSYPFEEAYFLSYARQFRAALDMPLILLGGITQLETVRQALDEGFAFVAMARALLREPDLVARWAKGDVGESLCVHCNRCMPTVFSGTHCVLVAPELRPGLNQPETV